MSSKRRDHGSGSVYQRASDGRWIGTFENGWTQTGARRRVTVSAKTEAECKRRLRDKRLAVERGEIGTSERTTVKAWADTYLEMRRRDLSPKGWNAAASPIRKWIVPTIGHRRLAQLTPADVRAVADAQRNAVDANGNPKPRQPADTHRVLKTMLKAAIAEGHAVPERLLHMDAPKVGKSDRQAMTVDQGIACLAAASQLPHGSRWWFTLIYGQRMGECLGLTWDAIDFTRSEDSPHGAAFIEWQLQSLPYNRPRDRASGFRVPDGHDARHLVDAYHLVQPKSSAGIRVAPLLEPMREELLKWKAIAPASPYGLVWPGPDGRPRNDKHDRTEWKELQDRAGVAHPSGRPFHVHECRNFAATMLLEANVDAHVITDLLGHTVLTTTLKYRTRRRAPLLEAMQRVGERLQLG